MVGWPEQFRRITAGLLLRHMMWRGVTCQKCSDRYEEGARAMCHDGNITRPLHYALVAPNVFFMLDLLETAAEPNRRRLLQLLGRGELSVNELAENFPVSRSAISQHLKLLADVGLVQARKDGRRRLYSLDPHGMARLRNSLESFWNTELDQLAADAAAVRLSPSPPHPKENSDDH